MRREQFFFLGERLTEDDEYKAESWVIAYKPEFLAGFLAFEIKDPTVFPVSMFLESVLNMYKSKPGQWWNVMKSRTTKGGKLPLEFCSFLSALLSIPPSSASLERIFSTFGLIWNKLRNRLGHEKATKLVKIHQFLNVKTPQGEVEEDFF